MADGGTRGLNEGADQHPDAGSPDEELSFILHELMNPVTVIEGFATMIDKRGDLLAPEDVRAYAGRISRSAAQLRGLIEAVVDARRIEGGSFAIETEPVDLGAAVAEIVADLAGITAAHPVAVDSAAGVVVHADAMRLRQVVTNLLSNAAKFSPDDLPIRVCVRRARDAAEVSVADMGPGVPAERSGELSRRFSRLGNKAPGMGIGLYISRGIARAHGGELALGASRPGEGARFVLTLPLSVA